MPITFINGFVVPKYKHYDEFIISDGVPDGGGLYNTSTVRDFIELPYARGNQNCNSLRLMNTGFDRIRYVAKTTAPVNKAVISFWLKFGVFSNDYDMGESVVFALRTGYSEGTITNEGRGMRICEIACRKDPDEHRKGSLEIWSSGDYNQQGNYTGSLIAQSSSKVIHTDYWYWCEITFNNGFTEVWIDGTRLVYGTVAYSTFTSHSIEWESFGFRGIMVSDYVFQEGSDAARLGQAVRVTTIFPARDKIIEGVGTSAVHYSQVNETNLSNAASYVSVSSSQRELYGMERGYPLGGLLAVCSNAILSGTAANLRSLYRLGDSGSLLNGSYFVDPFGRSTANTLPTLFYAGALSVRDPNGNQWDDSDWVATWQAGFISEGDVATIHQFSVERLYLYGAGAGARYISF